MTNIIVTTGNEIPGKKIIGIIGVVRGSTVRARNIGRDIGAGFKNIIGGEIKTYTEMTNHARDESFNRMVNQAIENKADAIIGTRIGVTPFAAIPPIECLSTTRSPLSRIFEKFKISPA